MEEESRYRGPMVWSGHGEGGTRKKVCEELWLEVTNTRSDKWLIVTLNPIYLV